MEFNKLPQDYQGKQSRRTEFESLEQKLQYDADNLIALAKMIASREGILVSPESLVERYDDNVPALIKLIALKLKNPFREDGGKGGEGINAVPKSHFIPAEISDESKNLVLSLSQEQRKQILCKLKMRFEARENWDLYVETQITWGEVEAAMKEDDLLCAYKAEAEEHEPAIFMVDDQGFWFGTMAKGTPKSTRNCVYDEGAAEQLAQKYRKCKSAVRSAQEMGFVLMTLDQAMYMAKHTPICSEDDWSWYYTDRDLRRFDLAFDAFRLDDDLFIVRSHVSYPLNERGWRGSRRVNFKDNLPQIA